MPGEPSESYQTDLERWLADLGFSRGNPFATTEADQERSLLPEFFVDVEGYDRIKGDRTIIVFAPRGGGKSALRVVLASQAAPISPEATTLTVEYTDFDALIIKWRSGQDVAVEDHMSRLLRAGAEALLNTLCGDPTADLSEEEAAKDRELRESRAASASAAARSRLTRLLRTYCPELLSPEVLYERLQALDSTFAPAWKEFVAATTERRLYELVASSALGPHELAGLLTDLNDYPDTHADPAATPTTQMKSFVSLAQTVGLISVQFLVDRLDEFEETADDPKAQADILEPLLAHLPVLETPGVAFKFFLSRETRDVLLERQTIRRDRLTDQAVTVTWDRGRLKHMLDERLAVYSLDRDGEKKAQEVSKVHDSTQLCRETRVHVGREQASRPLGEWIEDEMLRLAQGSPRRLLIAAQLLCEAHVKRCGPSGLLEEADWEVAKAELMRKMPPTLRLRLSERIALVGDREVRLTQQENKILLMLAAHGRCRRETLVDAVWGAKDGVRDAAVDQAIGRLRKKLGDDSSNPVYLVTERSEGFKLLHYEVE